MHCKYMEVVFKAVIYVIGKMLQWFFYEDRAHGFVGEFVQEIYRN